MIEFSMIVLAGLLGSSHCLGMCGGFALLLGMESTTPVRNLLSQLNYSLGRIFTYAVLGAFAGFVGNRITASTQTWVNASAALSLLAGLFLIIQGLKAAGVSLIGGTTDAANQGCLASPILRLFLKSRKTYAKFLAGVLTGFLPCGLLYAFLALAGASRDLLAGAIIMTAFGLGTVPLMIFAGIGGRMMNSLSRQRVLRIAAWCVVITGTITVSRGIGYFRLQPDEVPPGCPWCPTTSSGGESINTD